MLSKFFYQHEKTSNVIKLYIKTPNEIADETTDPIQIIYRIYYKVTKIVYNYKALRSYPRDETILVEANLRKLSIQIPKRLTHEEVIRNIPRGTRRYNRKIKD